VNFLSLEGLSTGDNLNQLGGNGSLTGLVVLELESAKHVIGVTGGVIHSSHTGGDLRTVILEHGTVDGDSEVELSEGLKDLTTLILSLKLLEWVNIGTPSDELVGRDELDGWFLRKKQYDSEEKNI